MWASARHLQVLTLARPPKPPHNLCALLLPACGTAASAGGCAGSSCKVAPRPHTLLQDMIRAPCHIDSFLCSFAEEIAWA